MTEISFYLDEEDNIFGFVSEGHAGHGSYGNDIVCAALSALTINCVNSLDVLCRVDPEVEARDSEGYMDVRVSDYRRDDVQLLFKSLRMGIEEIARNYEKNVKLTIRRCKP